MSDKANAPQAQPEGDPPRRVHRRKPSPDQPAVHSAKPNGGNGASAPAAKLPTIPRTGFRLREIVNNSWRVNLPNGIGRSALTDRAIWSTAPEGVERGDLLWVMAYDESFLAELLALEAATQGLAVQVLRLIELPPRDLNAPGESLPARHRIYKGRLDEGWVVARENPDGTEHVMSLGRDHPEWLGQYKAARAWLEAHVTILKP